VTRGGRIAFTLVAVLVVAVSVLGVILASPSDQHADQEGGVFFDFGLVSLAVVVGLDATFRLIRGRVRPKPSQSVIPARFDTTTGRPMWRTVAIAIVLTPVLVGMLTGCGTSAASQGATDLGALSEPVGSGGGSGHPAPSTVLTVSSLGGVRLGETKAQVDRVLGGGVPAPSVGGLTVVGYPAAAIVVTFKTDQVFSLATGDARYQTKQGVGVGATAAAVKKLGNASCIDLGGGAFDCKVDDSGGSGGPPLIDFQGTSGKVRRVEVQSVNE
jgi:hypothetical protein